MIITTLLVITLLALLIVTALIVTAGGAITLVLFGDVIVAIAILWFLIKRIFKRRK